MPYTILKFFIPSIYTFKYVNMGLKTLALSTILTIQSSFFVGAKETTACMLFVTYKVSVNITLGLP